MAKLPEIEMKMSNEHIKKVLKERSKLLQESHTVAKREGDQFNAFVFTLGDEQFAFDADFITEILPLNAITPLPCAPDFLLGIINLRGEILSVIDTKRFMNIQEQDKSDRGYIVLVKHNGVALGFLVDSFTGNRPLYLEDLQRNPNDITNISEGFVLGVTKERTVVLDINALLSGNKIIIKEEI